MTRGFADLPLLPCKKVGEDRVGDALDCLTEQSVEPLERWMRY